MKKVLVGLAVVGVLVTGALAVYLITPDPDAPGEAAAGGKKGGKKASTSGAPGEAGEPSGNTLRPVSAGDPADPSTGSDRGVRSETKDPGQYRDPNKAELEQEARLARPYNKHVYTASSWWGRAAQILLTSNPELSKEIRENSAYMREMANLNGDQLKTEEVLAREAALLQKLQSAGGDAELRAITGYLEQSLKVTMEGGDPSTVEKPAIP